MEQPELLQYAIQSLERLGITYMVVGSLASSVYGEPRSTLDIDIVIAPTAVELEELCEAFPAPDFYVSKEAARDALRRRSQFNVLHPMSGNKIDFMIASGDAWCREQIAGRRRLKLAAGQDYYAARPEDVILGKLLYFKEGGSEKHLRDVAAIMKKNGPRIDRGYLDRWVEQLDLTEEWQAILARLAQ
jgi:hypothetical protein